MKRRVVLKQIMLTAVAAAWMPSCTWKGKKASILLKNISVDSDQEQLLSDVVDTLIPETDIVGAKSLEVHLFVLKMLDDCYSKEMQDTVVKGLEQVNQLSDQMFSKSFGDASPEEREKVLAKIDGKDASVPAEISKAYPVIKQLSIRGFMTAQYVMTEIQQYEMIPGRFNGCFPVEAKKKSA